MNRDKDTFTKNTDRWFWPVFAAVAGLVVPNAAAAVPPPDFVFNVATQVAQFFTVAVIFLSAFSAGAFRIFSVSFHRLKHRVVLYSIAAVLVLAFSAGTAYFFGVFEQQRALTDWLRGATARSQATGSGTEDVVSRLVSTTTPSETFVVGAVGTSATTTTAAEVASPGEQFIRTYYRDIARHAFESAYAASTQSVSFDTFRS